MGQLGWAGPELPSPALSYEGSISLQPSPPHLMWKVTAGLEWTLLRFSAQRWLSISSQQSLIGTSAEKPSLQVGLVPAECELHEGKAPWAVFPPLCQRTCPTVCSH